MVIVAALFVTFKSLGSSNILTKNANKTTASTSSGYRLDLRIYGTYNNKRINKIVSASNYKNQDKTITVSNLTNGKIFESVLKGDNSTAEDVDSYVIKGNKYYKVENGELKDVKDVAYKNPDIYLDGIKKMKNIKQESNQTIADTVYKVYSGTVSKSVINDIASNADEKFEFDKDCNVEVWLTQDDYVYKVYYKVDQMTFYASYFAIGKTGKINLDEYKKEAV